jgi:hypothetical protein
MADATDQRLNFRRLWIAEDAPQTTRGSGEAPTTAFTTSARGFATLNADRLTPDVLQHLMQHQDYQTTQRYINLAR